MKATPALHVEFTGQLDLPNARDLLVNLVRAELTARYKTPVLGMLWFLLSPVVLAAILIGLFQGVIRLPIERYPVFLVAGLIPWTFFQVGVTNATGSLLRHQALVKRARIPRALLPLSTVLASFVHFVVSIAITVAVFLAIGQSPASFALLLLPLIVLLHLLIVCGIGLAASALNVLHRDIEHLVAVLLRFGFWLTPIFYSIDHVPERWRSLLFFNPMTPLLEGYRAVLMHGAVPGADVFIYAAGFGAAFLAAGIAVFNRLEAHLDDHL